MAQVMRLVSYVVRNAGINWDATDAVKPDDIVFTVRGEIEKDGKRQTQTNKKVTLRMIQETSEFTKSFEFDEAKSIIKFNVLERSGGRNRKPTRSAKDVANRLATLTAKATSK